jgi:hypothetical protein
MKRNTILIAFIVIFSTPLNFALAQESGSSSSVGTFEAKIKTEGVTQKTEGNNNGQNLSVGGVEGSRIDGKFFSNVEIKGDITQLSDGSLNNQNLSIGSVQGSQITGNYDNKSTKTGAIRQSISGGGSNNQQNLSVGSVQGSTVKDFQSKIKTGDLTQDVQGGSNSTQEMLIGSVNNSTVQGGTVTSDVKTKNITQISTQGGNAQSIQIGSINNSTVAKTFDSKVVVTGDITQTAGKNVKQELMLGSVSGANVGSFSSDVKVNGKIEQSATGSGGHSQSALFGSVR